MGWFVTGIVLTIIAIIGIFIFIAYGRTDNAWEVSYLHCLWGFFGLLIIIPGFIGNVETGEVGIKTRWGQVVSTNLNEGLQIKAPWEEIIKMNIKVQKYENEVGLSSSSKDLQVLNDIIVAVNYQLEGDKAVELYRNVGENYSDTILLPAIQESVKSVLSQYTAEEIVTKRSEIANDINNNLSDKLKEYGIISLSVAIKNFDFSAEYNAAIERKVVAEQEVQTSKQQLERAKIDAETKKVQAQAESESNAILEKTLTKEILTEEFIQKWNGQLPTTFAGGDVYKIFGLN